MDVRIQEAVNRYMADQPLQRDAKLKTSLGQVMSLWADPDERNSMFRSRIDTFWPELARHLDEAVELMES